MLKSRTIGSAYHMMINHLSSFLLVAATGLALSAPVYAELSLPNFFSDHMLLQRDKPVAIWGTADANAKVKVSFAGESATTTANADGAWKISLPPLPANSKGAELTVSSGKEKKSIDDVLVGELWFASGQSNMAFPVSRSHQATEDIAESDHPGIRMFIAKLTPASTPQKNIGGSWSVCSPATVPKFSAVAYFFALELHRELGVPVGIINSSWGGKPVETFTSREALASIPEGQQQLEKLNQAIAAFDPEKAQKQYKSALVKYETALAAWKEVPKAERKRQPKKPKLKRNPAATEGRPGTLYNGMIHPFVGYTMHGAIWYQGEANAKTHASSKAYGKLFPLMITDWRKRWNDDFTFLWVQLANFREPSETPGANDSWAHLQDEQRKSLSLTKSGMAVTNDIGAATDIHPKNKKEVGRRLSLWALSGDYGKTVTPTGPLYLDHKISDSSVHIRFTHSKNLKTRNGGPIKKFEIAGDDKVWHWADAQIQGDRVIVSSSEVPNPVAVRYAWNSNPEGANLVNGEGLPTSVFRTDDWLIE